MILATITLNIVDEIDVFRLIWGRRIRIRRDFEPTTLIGGGNLKKFVEPTLSAENFFTKNSLFYENSQKMDLLHILIAIFDKNEKNRHNGPFLQKVEKIFF
jgi:hypothetical protein